MAALAAACVVYISAARAQESAMALPRVSVACVREEPRHSGELGTQVVMGTPVKITGRHGEWMAVETPEGYHGYIIANSLQPLTANEFDLWKQSKRVAVSTTDQTYIFSRRDDDPTLRVSDVVNGSIIQTDCTTETADSLFTPVRLPDGRHGYIRKCDVMPLQYWADRKWSAEGAIAFATAMTGTPYLWGGTTSKSADCSGMTKAAFLSQGVILPRNASQQALVGTAVDFSDLSNLIPGDLLFFGNRATKKVNHVGMYIGHGKFIHDSGRVKINSLIKGDSDYTPLALLGARRLDSATLQRLALKNHPWYF